MEKLRAVEFTGQRGSWHATVRYDRDVRVQPAEVIDQLGDVVVVSLRLREQGSGRTSHA
jgi:hypothetical protein